MHSRDTFLMQLYLPLLTDPQPAIRRQACALLLANHGEQGLTLLRRLLSSTDHALRRQAGQALEQVADLTGLAIIPQAFSGLYIECLGRTRLYAGDREIQLDVWVRKEHASAGWQKVQGVLAYLLHCGQRGTTRATLAAAIWNSAAPTTIGRTLKAVQRLMAELLGEESAERAATFSDQFCLLNPAVYRTDVQTFEQIFNLASHTEEAQGLEAAASLYAQAMRMYGGPYMIDIIQATPWAQERRDHLRGSFLIAAERVAEHAFAQHNYHECVITCTQVFDADESADECVAWLLRAHYRLGHRSAVEHVYRRYLYANGIDEHSPEARQDVVVQTYEKLRSLAAA